MDNLKIENAEIGFKNFAGHSSEFNDEGNRNFCVFFDDDMADQLAAEGWNVKQTKPDDDGHTDKYIPVTVRYGVVPPTIVLINSVGQRLITEDTVAELDAHKLKDIDLVIRPYEWEYRGKSGVKAMLKTMYAKIEEDEFASKYADVPKID